MHIGVLANVKVGLEQFVYRELRFFTQAGLSISLFPTRYGPGLYNPRPEWKVHPWHPLGVLFWQLYSFFQGPVLYLQLLREALAYGALMDFALAWYFSWRMQEVDVIYATFGDHKLFVGYFCKRILHKPLVVTTHAYELYANPNRPLFVHALAACDQIITVTEHNREYLSANFQVDPSRVQVVRYSLDLEEYRPCQKFIVLIVSFFTYRKGHDTLLQAVKQLGRKDVEVWVVGDVAGRKGGVDVRALARQIGIDSQVAFFGALSGNALRAVYQAADVVCLPSRRDRSGAYEGFPNVLIEAMAVGKPVITTRHVEIPRIIPEILIDENDVDALTAALDQVYCSAELRQRLGCQNRQIAETHFSPTNTQGTVELFCSLLRSTGVSPAERFTPPIPALAPAANSGEQGG